MRVLPLGVIIDITENVADMKKKLLWCENPDIITEYSFEVADIENDVDCENSLKCTLGPGTAIKCFLMLSNFANDDEDDDDGLP